MTEPFILTDDGWHEPTKRHYLGRMRDYVTSATEEGDRYRRLHLGLEQKRRAEGKREVKPRCVNLGEWTGGYVELLHED